MEVSAESYLATDRATIKIVHDENDKDFIISYNGREKCWLSELLNGVKALERDL